MNKCNNMDESLVIIMLSQNNQARGGEVNTVSLLIANTKN